ncbi:hypothetical protein V3C99_001861, partial [Haemonchus contortus]
EKCGCEAGCKCCEVAVQTANVKLDVVERVIRSAALKRRNVATREARNAVKENRAASKQTGKSSSGRCRLLQLNQSYERFS